ncbi:MAG: SPASM domain-containing protein, partial [Phycisphaeraceae bacterium]
DQFKKVTGHLQWLLTTRNRRGEDPRKFPHAKRGVPWLVPRMVKTAQTLGDMESFYDRWVHFAGHAVIEPAGVGNGSVSQMRVPRMAPPRRFGCRQIANRMTIHADGRVARCDQDWHARAAAGKSTQATLAELWQSMQPVRICHEQGQWNDLELCRDCHQWHRP